MDTFPTLNQEPAHTNSDVDDSLMSRSPALSPIEVDDLPQPPPLKKQKAFRMNAKQFMLTFPQCDTKKETVVERIDEKWKDDIKGYVVSEEKHKDGTPHLHVFLQFHNKKNFKTASCFDFLTGQHGDYEVAKSLSGAVTYCIKDGNFLAKGLDLDKIKKARKGKISDSIARRVQDGETLAQIAETEPGFCMINKRKIEDYASWVTCERSKRNKIDWIVPSLDGLTDSNLKIAEWISKNIRQTRAFKAPQLYIHGPRNLGKTSLVEWLEKSLSVYHMPMTEEFYDLYADDFDIVVLDEFKGQKTIQFLNQFLQGSPMPIRKKGSQAMKYKNLPVVILSNYSLSECYVKACNDGRLSTLECRLEIVEIDSFIDFYNKA